MTSPLTDLEPQPVWSHFDGIRQIPRPSKHEERISRWVQEWAAKHGFEVRSDAAGNLAVAVPARPGFEAAPKVVLQSHLDMVCEKNSDVSHDFMNDPIRVAVQDDWVVAEGTTLGADNGLGVASSMGVAIDPEVAHGPLELLFTLDEETGLNGASALDPTLVTGELLINLDTEEDDAIYIGCAGASGIEGVFGVERVGDHVEAATELAVTGLSGGHSGIDIIENRGNAIRIAARILEQARTRGVDFALISFDGGSARNALARECFVTLQCDAASRRQLEAVIEEVRINIEGEFGDIEPDLNLELRPASKDVSRVGLRPSDRDRLLRTLVAAPHGVIAMSREVPGLVETSVNLALVTTKGDEITVLYSLRSSVNAALTGTLHALRSLFELAGASVKLHGSYPGWKPNPNSDLVQRTVAAYERLFEERPEIKAVHAGLECGILVEKVPGLDAVSIGPEIRNPHSPDERARISSVAKFYRLLKEVLADLAQAPASA